MLILIDSLAPQVADALGEGARALGATSARWVNSSRQWPEPPDFLIVTGAEAPALARIAADMRTRTINPRKTIVRAIGASSNDWIYHDLPVFASIKSPSDAAGARELLQRLLRARDQEWTDGPVPGAIGPAPARQSCEIHAECERLVTVAAGCDLKVLIVGETGTGKTVISRRIHERSGRQGSYVSLNCASLPESLIESELFGVEPGAFTGAQRPRPGKFELADKGTLFLDEIDSLPLHLQSKLLSAIQDSGTTRLGDHRFRSSDFRLVTATQRPLEQLVSENRFRADLMYRVSVIQIELPPVRQVGSELITAFESMLHSECERLCIEAKSIEPSLYPMLLSHDWPGNYRELHTAAQRYAVGLSPLKAARTPAPTKALRNQMQDIERQLLRKAIRLHKGSLRTASAALGMPLETLRYRLRLLGVLDSTQEHGLDGRPSGES